MEPQEISPPRLFVRRPSTQPRWLEGQHIALRFLTRVALALIVLAATIANRADNDARAKGLLSVRIEPLYSSFAPVSCLSTDPDEAPPPPPPEEDEKPPQPKSRLRSH